MVRLIAVLSVEARSVNVSPTSMPMRHGAWDAESAVASLVILTLRPLSASWSPTCLGSKAGVEFRIVGVIGILPDHTIDEVGIPTDQDV